MNSQKKLIKSAVVAFIFCIGMNSCQSNKNSGCNYWGYQDSEVNKVRDEAPKEIKYKIITKAKA